MNRHQNVCKGGKKWSCKHEKHDGAVHGEELVVLLFAGHNLEARRCKLGANDQGHDTGNYEVGHRGDQVKVTDFLMVSGG